MQITYFGHACLLVEEAGQRVLIDPGTFSTGFEGLHGLDAVVITHQHPDHVDLERVPGLLDDNPDARVIVEPQTGELLGGRQISSERLSDTPLEVGGLTVSPVGHTHAEIHPYIPRIGNIGVVLQAGDGPRLYHPGDSYEGDPGKVDVLAVPLTAPWASVRETIAFVRRLGPPVIVPIHDGTASPRGRAMYLTHVGTYGGEALQVQDLADGRPWNVALS